MFRLLFLLLVMASCTIHPQAQNGNEGSLKITDLESQDKIAVSGNLSAGTTMPLRWATNSSVACFPATRFNEYQGNHVLYRVQMPAASKIQVTVTPKSKKHRINLYALRLGADNMSSPPDISSAISCEASYPIWAGKPNYNKAAKPQSIDYISINRPYTILIGVAGATGLTEADFDLEILIGSR